ncbi:hypothetical protein WA556_003556 [Blastocystis sp. ATCC 50177/Nand II]
MERSREALLLRLEQMKMQAEKHEETDDDDDRHSESSDDDSIPSNPAKRSKAIPITKTRNRNYGGSEGRGFTDDMMYFAAVNDDRLEESDDDTSNSTYVPPHLQHNDSFTVRSFA